jgi:glycosyltransferase involved in cell wall biosynthesis
MTAPHHILLVNVFFAPFSYGGATVVAEQVAQALIKQRTARISAVSLISRSDLAPYTVVKSEKDGIPNYLINVPSGRSYAQIYDNPQVTQVLARLIDTLAPDLMHVHCIQEIGAGIFEMAQDKGLPTILSVHDFWWICDRQFMIRVDNTYCGQNPVRIEACQNCVEDYAAARARFQRLNEMGNRADLVTYPSHFARDLSEASGFAPGKGVVWENGVRLPGAGFFEAQNARRAADPRTSFGFVGGPSQIKGWPIIRRAFGKLGRNDFRGLVVEGSLDGSWWAGHDLSALPGDWHVYPRFTQDEMDAFYAQIDVLLFMSQWKETFGLAIREALARGIKVIQTDSGGTVEHGAVATEDLIPIGAGPETLRLQLEAALQESQAYTPHPKIASFDDQAAAFTRLMTPLLG